MGMHIIITGNPIDGFTYTGPFKTRDDALMWTEENSRFLDPDWWLVKLDSPQALSEAA